MSKRLGEAGASVLLLARSETELTLARDEIRAAGGEAYSYVLDLTSAETVDQVSQTILQDIDRSMSSSTTRGSLFVGLSTNLSTELTISREQWMSTIKDLFNFN